MNGWQLTFSGRFEYSRFNHIVLPLKLSSDKANQILLTAKVDTGSTLCVFQRRYGDLLNIDLETGTLQRIRTATGSFTAYGHEVTIGKLAFRFNQTIPKCPTVFPDLLSSH